MEVCGPQRALRQKVQFQKLRTGQLWLWLKSHSAVPEDGHFTHHPSHLHGAERFEDPFQKGAWPPYGNRSPDEKLALKVTDQMVGQKVEGNLRAATHRLKLNTINGNMYLRR